MFLSLQGSSQWRREEVEHFEEIWLQNRKMFSIHDSIVFMVSDELVRVCKV